ncbi:MULTISPECIES: acyl-CoA dehydrogenase [unclassified Streptomyces]|uniref:acyl-CoA dehydrogenase family protein n=1 Tax=unclassified Streptomyces TaxID=2593676 RepID=UPI00035E2D7B|nr:MULTISPECIES: acyl-CoA dehydrogenase [unclassified Streptomyces]MYY05680.1 acyl-CoA oxidase [Streptomyces sp. SID4913]
MTTTLDSPDAPGTGADPLARPLTSVLLGADAHREHGFWRRLIATEPFRLPTGPRTGGTPEERLARAYARLRTLNDALDSAARPACDPRALAALHEWLAPVDPALATIAGIHYNLFLGSLIDHDTGCPRDLSDYLLLRRTGTFLCTEVDHGNDAAAIETTATYDPVRDGFVVHTPHCGAQKFMPNTGPAGGPKSGLVAARLIADGTDHGVFLLLVPLTDAARPLPGVRVRRLPARMGSPVDHCLTSFDQVFVRRDALLAGPQGRIDDDGVFRSATEGRRRRFLASIARVVTGRICMSASAVGSARATLAVAVRYGGHRYVSAGRRSPRVPVIAHRSHHGPLAEAMATVFAMSLLHRRVLDRWEAAAAGPAAGREVAERLVDIAKGWITWRAREVIVESRERCGAQGLLENNGLTALVTGVEGAITAEGDNLAVHARAAATMVFAATAGPAHEPAAHPPAGDLTDLRFLVRLLERVEEIRFAQAAARMAPVAHGDPLERWNAASGPALRGVETHAARQAAEAYADAVDALPAGPARDRLDELARLFALGQVARSSGVLLAAGHLGAGQVEDLTECVERLIGAVAPRLPELADSFAFPDEVLDDWPITGARYADAYDDPDAHWHTAAARKEAGESR